MHSVAAIQRGTFSHIAPAAGMDRERRHEGNAEKKPWEYNVTVALPHLNTIEPLRLVIELLRLQTERPYILVLDTGSDPDLQPQLEALRADDLEVHRIAGHGYRHSSEPVCVALDLAHSLCRTKWMFHTHSDCFLRRRDFVESLRRMCSANTPALGYRMSPRDWIKGAEDWEWMVGHVALMLYMPSIHRAGATWSYQRTHYQYKYPWHVEGGWPDTETGFNCGLRDAGIKPVFIANERNYGRQTDDSIDHVRSFSGVKLYSPERLAEAAGWMQDAMSDAAARVKQWQAETL